VAIKEYLPQQFAWRNAEGQVVPRSDEDAETFNWGLSRFIDEARALALFRHPNIVSVLRYLEANGTAYLIMDYERGEDLKHWMRKHGSNFNAQQLVNDIALPVLDGLSDVHATGMVHRDIKPDNIFIRENGSPVLIDFGASRSTITDTSQKLTSIISEGYSPFEQYGGEKQGPWTDLYALAGTFYHVVTGQAPLGAISRHQGQVQIAAVDLASEDVPQNFLKAIDQALELDVAARPQSAEAMRNMIETGEMDGGATFVRDASAPLPTSRVKAQGSKQEGKRSWLPLVMLLIVISGAGGVYVTQPALVGEWLPFLAPQSTPSSESAATATPAIDNTADEQAIEAPVQPEPEPAVAEVRLRLAAQPTYPSAAIPRQLRGFVNLQFTVNEEGKVKDPVVLDSEPADVFVEAALLAIKDFSYHPPQLDDQVVAAQGVEYRMEFEPPAITEDMFVEGLRLPTDVQIYRQQNIGGTILAYIEIKKKLDRCRETDPACDDLGPLIARARAALAGDAWNQGPYSGRISVANPRKIPDRPDCEYSLDVMEEIHTPEGSRAQKRGYCTSNGFNRTLESISEIEVLEATPSS